MPQHKKPGFPGFCALSSIMNDYRVGTGIRACEGECDAAPYAKERIYAKYRFRYTMSSPSHFAWYSILTGLKSC